MALGVIIVIVIISWSRVFSWATGKYCSWAPQQPSGHPLSIRAEESYQYRHLQNASDDYDDSKPQYSVTDETI